jgi:hypothetical protein
MAEAITRWNKTAEGLAATGLVYADKFAEAQKRTSRERVEV